jgi:hypothetical protein
MTLRYGLAGARPLTVIELAASLKLKPIGVARLLQRAQRELRALMRGGKTPTEVKP